MSVAGNVRGWWNIAKKSRKKNAGHFVNGRIGDGLFRDLAIHMRNSLFWDWRQRRTVEIEPDVYSPLVDGAEVRARHGLNGKVVIGFIGTFGPWHDWAGGHTICTQP